MNHKALSSLNICVKEQIILGGDERNSQFQSAGFHAELISM